MRNIINNNVLNFESLIVLSLSIISAWYNFSVTYIVEVLHNLSFYDRAYKKKFFLIFKDHYLRLKRHKTLKCKCKFILTRIKTTPNAY